MKPRLAAALCAGAALFCTAMAPAASLQELNKQAYEAYKSSDYVAYAQALEQMYSLRPQNGDVMFKLAGAYALQEQTQKAFDILLRMVVMGLAYDIREDEDFENLHLYPVYEFVASNLENNSQPFGASEVAFTIEQKDLLGESVAYDEKTGDFLVSSVRKGKIMRVSADGSVRDFITSGENGLWGAFGMKVDSERRHLWVASSALPQYEGFRVEDFGHAGIFKFDLDTGELLKKFPVQADGFPHLLGDLVLSSTGDVYASDSQTPMIFRLRHDADQLEVLFTSPEFVNLQGIALSPDDRHLFLADYQLGIFVADLEAERIGKLQVPRDVNVGGIDGLYYYGNRQLIAVQNGIRPNRVVRFWVDENYSEIVSTEPIESSNAVFDDPTLGTFVGEDFYYVANSQWPLYGSDGKVSDPARLADLVVLKTTIKPDDQPPGDRIVPVKRDPSLQGPAGAPKSMLPESPPEPDAGEGEVSEQEEDSAADG